MSITRIALALTVVVTADAAQRIDKVFIPIRLSNTQVYHDPATNKFSVCRDGRISPINNYDVSPRLRDIVKNKALGKFLETAGYLSLNEIKEGDTNYYSLRENVQGKGGGPFLAFFLYGLVKAVCYGGISVAIGRTIGASSSGNVIIAAAGECGHSLPAGAGLVAAGVEHFKKGAAVTTATLAVGQATAATGIVGAIESASVMAFNAGLCMPMTP